MTRPLAAQRHDELGERSRNRFDVSRIGAHVVDHDRLAFGDGGADQAVPHFHAKRAPELFGIADRVGDRELAAPRIEQVDRERLKLRDPRDELRDLLQQLRQIEHGRDLASQLEQGDDEFADVGCGWRGNDGFGHVQR